MNTHQPTPPPAPARSPRPSSPVYLHGYAPHEARRLGDQADTLAALLHAGTAYPPGSRVLEAGCGVGAQTVHLVASSPGARIVAVDRAADSLAQARGRLNAQVPHAGDAVRWQCADLRRLPFSDASFDHVFVCFVLEHLAEPARVLAELRRVLRPGGTLTAIEGDHGSVVFHPDSPAARALVGHQIRLQAAAGGNALVGRELYALLRAAGYAEVDVRPRTVYADGSRPGLVDGFTRRTFIAMVESLRDEALAAGLTTPGGWDRGLADLRRAAEPGGSFHYTFFKAVAVAPHPGPERPAPHSATSVPSRARVPGSAGMQAKSLTPGASRAASLT
ncbi:methyltransferase domain-containing protein [Streptomyces sp. RS10V-4]|uniref:methyltransferase domain-containing protein n=1 Tax=Streptomyces rhizoryzae TaxID=2932493 RepID=UPI0020057290|nr:methyltransferase domain-containing protein [Streptomyces rhizoryzae]MCK7626849.1 methyltransferase domain-containing protein [Streptomyces rhizoryzae]